MHPLLSMTGYASRTREIAGRALGVEIKGVNGRFLDVQFRMPDELRATEPALREAIAARVNRGKIEVRVTLAMAAGGAPTLRINDTLLDALAALDQRVRQTLPDAAPLSVSQTLAWPGMLGDDANAGAAVRDAVPVTLGAALDEFMATRAREGDKLKAMLLERVATMDAVLIRIQPLLPRAIAAYQEKLTAKLREALGSQDDERVRQEIAVFAVRADVAEEMNRLAAHLTEVRRVLDAGGPAGKRLDFLMQELQREANTLGSKSVARELSEASLELKLLVEQMREQIQNIE